MEKMQTFYFHCNIDVFKVAVFVPGIVCQMLFQIAHRAKVSFGLIHANDDDLYYTIKPNFIGGPSIIFTQEAEVGGTFIRDDPTRPCNSIVGYNANALYLDCINKSMLCGGYVHRSASDFRPDSRLHDADMYHWMDHFMETEGEHILHGLNHIGEVRSGPYLLDGFDPITKTAYEYHGCYFHGCSPCKKDEIDIEREQKQHTEILGPFGSIT